MYIFKNLLSADKIKKIAEDNNIILDKGKMNIYLERWGTFIQKCSKRGRVPMIIVRDFNIQFTEEEKRYARMILNGKKYKTEIVDNDLLIKWD